MHGSIVALITPFNTWGEVDYQALERLIDFHKNSGTDALVLCGSTGEGTALSKKEKLAIFKLSVEVANGQIPIIASVGTNQTFESIRLAESAKNVGVNACIAIVPYYNRPTEKGCFEHFRQLTMVGLPLILYHHPGRTGIKLSLDALKQICSLPGVIGIKDASGDLNLAYELIQQMQIPFFSGDDTLAFSHLALGASGSISIVANVIPMMWREFVHLGLNGNLKEALKIYKKCHALCGAMVLETNPQCVKYAASLVDQCLPKMRLPLTEPSEETREKIKTALQTVESVLQ